MQSKFIINADVRETVCDSDLEAYKIKNPNECKEINQEITNLQERDYLSVEQEIFLEPQPQRGQERKCQALMGRNQDGSKNLSHKQAYIYWADRNHKYAFREINALQNKNWEQDYNQMVRSVSCLITNQSP